MKIFKSHFWYNKGQRNGIFFLVLLIIALQAIYVFADFSSNKATDINTSELTAFQRQIDSLKLIEIEKRKPKVYRFNPNYITDFKGARLGMSVDEIDRLLLFRKQGKFINSAREFQQVTKISDSLLNVISPLFKFPDWLQEANKRNSTKKGIQPVKKFAEQKPQVISTTDVNLATADDFRTIKGIGEKLSKRIVKYRKRLQGFTFKEQLYEVWGVDKELADRVLETFSVISKPDIKKININTASFKEVLSNPYIDYDLCKKIFAYRDEIVEFQSLEELRNINNFPLDKYSRITLYLLAE